MKNPWRTLMMILFLLASTCPDPPMNIVNPPPVTIEHRDQSSSISSGSLQFSSDDYNKGNATMII
jgi:hypothetical protein